MNHSRHGRPALAGAMLLTLGACVTAIPEPSAPPASRPPPRIVTERTVPPPARPIPVPQPDFVAPRILRAPGLEGVIEQNAAGLERQFGAPRLDMREGDMRKLQFAGDACVLDVYLYPLRRGTEPVATYVDARRASDGQDVDRAACVAALRRR